MGKKEISTSSLKSGMNRDTHLSQLKPEEYILAKNANIYNETGNTLSLQPEHSNILTVKFEKGYKVIGVRNHVNKHRTYYFLTNPSTGMSKIGYVSNLQEDISIEEPLEDIQQEPTHEFVTLLEDTCDGCLNFSIHHPIKHIVIKEEITGTKLYWTDYYNEQRHINVDEIEELYNGKCLDCDKLRMFPLYRPIELEVEDLQVGGNLRRGTYEFMVAYCNQEGVEMTDYHSITQPVYVLDRDNVIMSDTELSDRTSYAIKLNVNFLDTKFTHYKVVCIMNTDQSTNYYEIAVNSTSNGNVVFTTEQNKEEVSQDILFLHRPTYKKAEILESSNGMLFQANVEQEAEWNLQPVVNLMGAFVKWITIETSEHVYQNGLLASKFKSRMRDEVYPKGIRFITDTGYLSTVYPLIPRPPKPSEIIEVEDHPEYNSKLKIEVDSVLQNATNCSSSDRSQYWQFYNTATNDGQLSSYLPSGITTQRNIGKYCITPDVYRSEPNQVVINMDEYEGFVFTGLQNFVSDYYEEVIASTCDTTDPEYNEGLCIIKNMLMGDYDGCQNPEDLFYEKCDGEDIPCCDDPYLLPELTRVLIQDVWIGLETAITLTGPEQFVGEFSVKFKINKEPNDPEPEELTFSFDTTTPVSLRTAAFEFVDKNKEDMEDYFIFAEYEQNTITFKNLNQYSEPPTYQGTINAIVEESTPISGGREEYLEREFPDEYSYSSHPKDCEIFERDDEGRYLKLADGGSSKRKIYKRREVIDNTEWRKADSIAHRENETVTGQSYYNNTQVEKIKLPSGLEYITTDYEDYLNFTYDGLVTEEWEIPSGRGEDAEIHRNMFYSNLHTNALWFKGDVIDGDVILEVTKLFKSDVKDEKAWDVWFGTEYLRIALWDDMSDEVTTPVASFIFNNVEDGKLIRINNKDEFLLEDVPIIGLPIPNPYYKKFKKGFYITIDTPVYKDGHKNTNRYLLLPRLGCYHVYTRPIEYNKIKITYDELVLQKQEKFEARCTLNVPQPDDCSPQAYETGEFSYWESVEVYPDNKELYDSSKLNISEEDLPEDIIDKFEEYFVDTVGARGYKLDKNKTDYTNKPIKHYKYPDSKVSEFVTDFQTTPFARTNIYPIGCTIDENVINSFLDIALKNKLITKEQRDSIVGYEFFVGDRTGNKSIQAKGIAFDSYNYEEAGKKIEYPNFPYNDLGENQFFRDERGATIQHPNSGNFNNKFTVLSPDIYKNNSFLPTEVNIEGYLYGNAKETITEVKGHPKWVILGKKAKTQATLLSTAEALTEGFMEAVESLETFRTAFGTSTALNIPGIILYVASRVMMFQNLFVKTGQYRLQWLKTFRDLGKPHNFASRITGVGDYSFMEPYEEALQKGQTLRGISAIRKIDMGRHTITDNKGNISYVNNEDREASMFLSFGDGFDVRYTTEYKNYDNNKLNYSASSRLTGGEDGCELEETFKNIASPYFSLKNYNPAQYGSIGNIKWKSTSYIGNLKNPKVEPRIFGGDIFITRFAEIRKIPFFLVTAMGQSDLTPFAYKRYSNLGENPTFYCDYELPDRDDISIGRALFPNIDSDYRFDCLTGESGMYLKPPTKFYLYYHGIPTYVVESEINSYYRYAKEGIENHFYPQNQDYKALTEQEERPIRTPNKLFYNNVYSNTVSSSSYRTLPDTYNKELYDKIAKGDNTVVYSDPDNSQYNLTDPWLIYRPNNFWQFSTDKGRLKDIKEVESSQMLVRFENMFAIFNAVDNINRITPQTSIQGTSGVFSQRPLEFNKSDLGFGGTQNTAMVSTDFGHFWVDVERGQVLMATGGGGNSAPKLQEISRIYNGEPTGMRNWFKQHLPFKIKKSGIVNTEKIDIDNSYNGVGISMGWDNRFERVFITKKDYKVNKGKKVLFFERDFYDISPDKIEAIKELEERNGWVFDKIEGNKVKFIKTELNVEIGEAQVKYAHLKKVYLDNNDIFEDVSWTIAFSPITGKWISYYDFKPNYYVPHTDYFQTGVNSIYKKELTATIEEDTDKEEEGLWSHLLTNKSYQVFYGKPYKYEVEFPVQNKGGKRVLEVVNYMMESIKYINEYDYYDNPELGMDEMIIYNTTNNSGKLLLNTQTSLKQRAEYPETINPTTQNILQTNDEGVWNVNYFFNRVKNDRAGINMWIQDSNQIDKEINEQSVSFYGKRITERMRGTEFAVNIKSKDTTHNKILKVFLIKEDISF